MQNNSSKLLKDNANTDKSNKNIILWIGIALPFLVFIASSGYAVIALWRAKSLQALTPAGSPFMVWVGNDITWAMKLSILSAGYFSVLLAYFIRKTLWQEKTKLGVLALFALVQSLLCLDYIAKLQWFADDGVTAKGLVIIGFSLINTFLLVQKPIKEEAMGLLKVLFHNIKKPRYLISPASLIKICNISVALSGLGISIFWYGGSLALLFLEISGHAIPFRKLGFLLTIVGSLPCLFLRVQSALPSVAENSQQNSSTLPAISFIWVRRIALSAAYLIGASLLLKINGLMANQLFLLLSVTLVTVVYSFRLSQKLHIFREPPNYKEIGYEIAIVFFAICSVVFGAGILNGKPMQSLYEVAQFWLLGLFVLSLLSHKNISKAIVWVLATWILGILCIYIFATIANPGFSGEDAYNWFVSVGIGSPFPLNYRNSHGRFYPLGHIIYNWLIYFPFRSSPIPYLLQNAVMLITGTALLYFSMPRKNTSSQIACLCSLLLILQLPDMTRIFMAIIYPEKSLYILLAWFLFALRYAEKQKTSYLRYISALVPLVIATYSKEPIFVIGLVYGLGRLLFCYRQDTKAQKLFSSLLIVNAIVFLLLYYHIAYIQEANYATGRQIYTKWEIIWQVLFQRTYGIYILPILWTVFRCYHFLLKKDRNFIMADMLLFSGLAYTVCYFILGLYFDYYYIPGFIIGFYAVASYISHYINLKNIQRINWNSSTRLITVFALLVLQLLLFVRPTQGNLWNAGNYQIRRKNYSMSSKQLYSLIQKGWSIYMLFYDGWGWASAQGMANWYGEVILNRGIWFYNKNPTSNKFENKSYIQSFGAPFPESLRFPEKSLILSNRNDRIKSLEICLTTNPKGTPDIYYLGKYNFNMLGGADFIYSIGEIPEDFVERFGLKPTKLSPPEKQQENTEPITEQKIEEE